MKGKIAIAASAFLFAIAGAFVTKANNATKVFANVFHQVSTVCSVYTNCTTSVTQFPQCANAYQTRQSASVCTTPITAYKRS